MKTMKKLSVILVMVLLTLGITTVSVSAAPKLNKKSKTVTVGNNYTVKIKGIKSSKIKKVKFTSSNKKVATVKKKSNTKAIVTAEKKGKAVITVKVTYWTPKSTIKSKKLKFKVTVKSGNNAEDKNKVDNNNNNSDDTNSVNPDTSWETMYKRINSYTIMDDSDKNNVEYAFVTGSTWASLDWYSEKEYKKVLAEIDRIITSLNLTDKMSEQEKAYRIGRYLNNNVKYYLPTHEQTISGTLFNKQTVCGGFAHTYAALCRYAGLDCEYIYTTTRPEVQHAWNIIRLGDYWYAVDMTGIQSNKRLDEKGLGYFTITDYFRSQYEEEDTGYSLTYGNLYKYVAPYYLSNDFIKTHPLDTMSYEERCQKDGISYLTYYELYNLPE